MDATAKLWDIQNGEEVFTLTVRSSGRQLRELCIPVSPPLASASHLNWLLLLFLLQNELLAFRL